MGEYVVEKTKVVSSESGTIVIGNEKFDAKVFNALNDGQRAQLTALVYKELPYRNKRNCF